VYPFSGITFLTTHRLYIIAAGNPYFQE